MNAKYISCFIALLLSSCISSEKGDSEIPIIDIEKELGNFQISRLSTFASSIRYVRLETNDDCLVTNNIINIYVEDGKIFVHDYEPYLKVFDARTGKYLYNIGAKGQGPGELPYMYTVDINPHDKKILLCWGEITHRFDFDGNFLGKTEFPVMGDDEQVNAPFFVIDYGKYKSTLKFGPDEENPALIQVRSIKENNKYVFLNFETMNASPEPYEDEIYREGRWIKFVNHSISGILDKQKKTFHFLLQPIKGIKGLENDIDKGIPFFVRSVSSKNQLVDYHQVYKFLEYAESLPALSDALADIVNQISEEDNPIVILAE